MWGTIRRRENQEHRRVRILKWQDAFMWPENGIRVGRPPMRPTPRSPRPVLHDSYHDQDSPRAAPPFRPPPGLPPPTGQPDQLTELNQMD